jgi:DNA-binding NarL/FixJ family response regulator
VRAKGVARREARDQPLIPQQQPFHLGIIELDATVADVDAGLDEDAARVAALSPREREVLTLLMTGKPNKQIAWDLGLSPRTVELHRAHLMARLEVGSLAEAVRLAVQAELGRGAGTTASQAD